MKNGEQALMAVFLLAGMLLGGCASTLQEKKSTENDPGNITQLKFTGSKVKLEHDF
jgi:uncharacterized protein YceK